MKRIRSGVAPVAAAVVGALILIPYGSHDNARATDAKAAAANESCVTDKCHAGMGKEKFVHGPVASGSCTSCHIPTGNHKFKPITNSGKLCLDCHERLDSRKVVHAPVRAGKCTTCHDPHQSPNKFQLRKAGGELCLLCHDRAMVSTKFVHGPVSVGDCTACHNPHQGDIPKLLVAKGNDLCFTCHTDKAEAFKSSKFSHAPAKDSCLMCHSPHGGNFRYNLPTDGEQGLCFSCHASKQQEIAEATTKHKGLETSKKCLACHDPHVAGYPKQLRAQPMDLCMTCHDREYNSPTGRTANMKELLAKNIDHHGPIKEKDCSSCHNTHGSKNFRMLREYFPPVFYSGYNPDNYKLCFMCHEQTLASEESTTTMTGFRNGRKNLHYVHVNKQTKGRTCRACHDAHATNNPRHIRDAVPFGAWKLPVGFTKTETGGSCLPGCHKKVSYDRDKPVENN